MCESCDWILWRFFAKSRPKWPTSCSLFGFLHSPSFGCFIPCRKYLKTQKIGSFRPSTCLVIHWTLFPAFCLQAILPSIHQLILQGSNVSLALWVCNYHHHYRKLDHTILSPYHFFWNNCQKEWVKQSLRGASLEPNAFCVGQIVLQIVGTLKSRWGCAWEKAVVGNTRGSGMNTRDIQDSEY